MSRVGDISTFLDRTIHAVRGILTQRVPVEPGDTAGQSFGRPVNGRAPPWRVLGPPQITDGARVGRGPTRLRRTRRWASRPQALKILHLLMRREPKGLAAGLIARRRRMPAEHALVASRRPDRAPAKRSARVYGQLDHLPAPRPDIQGMRALVPFLVSDCFATGHPQHFSNFGKDGIAIRAANPRTKAKTRTPGQVSRSSVIKVSHKGSLRRLAPRRTVAC